MLKKNFTVFIVLLAVSVYLFSCGGSRKEESLFDEPTQEEQAQKKTEQDEMSELEALLGIKREPKKEEKKADEQPANELGLLGADEGKGIVKKGNQQKSEEEPVGDVRLAKLQRENESLRKSIREKNQRIRELESEIEALKQELAAAQENQGSTRGRKSTSNFTGGEMDYVPTTYDINEYKSRYQEALNYFNQRNYEAALNIFTNLLRTDTNNELADNVQYWIGECHYLMGNYKLALTDFEKVFTFPKSNKNDYALFKIALCYIRLGDRERAREELQRFLDEYPNSPLVGRATELMGKL